MQIKIQTYDITVDELEDVIQFLQRLRRKKLTVDVNNGKRK